MSGLTFTKDATGLVRIQDENGDVPDNVEPASILELTPPPTPTRDGKLGTANIIPMEILCLILEFVNPKRQDVFAATSKVSRLWYHASAPFLYRCPKITGNNYLKFAAIISPSSTLIKPSSLGSLVKRLDLSALVYQGRPSLNARLLRRVQANLEEFVAPQTTFGYNCIVALGHLQKLRLLDLSLISQSVNLDDLFQHIGDLPNLRTLNFPRSSVLAQPQTRFLWPKRLESFSLSGAILDYFLHETQLPETLHELHISHCPFTRSGSVIRLAAALSLQLTSLSITYPMPCLAFNALDNILNMCPHLTYLLIAVDYISNHFFDFGLGHPLKRLDLDSSGNPGVEHKVSPNDVFIAVAEDRLPDLRIVRVSRLLKWVVREKGDVDDLVDMLEAKAREATAAPAAGDDVDDDDDIASADVGVWEFGDARGNG
ncbi:hypothetical protein BZA05DRAFT_342117 [Tricharina praecox]|uniref:uncharacterized protein n=1 Tax=Tricharina praecox TaxID=43433 RepID=UPI002220F923|nr:uncharacterized protein BZA05DRAFT_342117 [Tricharina praecox]KAI5845974.1 hypothetical protein BZA05DRAFT_342117 [Tricharina praecox]